MSINVQVEKNDKENTAGLLRRFTKRVRGSGILSRVRGIRYYDRQKSTYVKKKKTLKRINKKAQRDEQIKLGKIVEQTGRYGRR
ncbi:MAG: 30S ribosomal protein S21 [Parcubacteria group bacterium]|nr:30S ribosomal protein S21 [Parcubacteria group bacterium]